MDTSRLEVVVENAADLAANDKEQFALIRRQGLGASDSSTVLGISKWNSVESLINQKRSLYVTPEELAIGEKPNVRMGADLEPFILNWFCRDADVDVYKPEPMYRLKEYPFLTINYDGIMEGVVDIPVEIKCVSVFAHKYWDWDKAIEFGSAPAPKPDVPFGGNIQNYIAERAEQCGIPDYYYTQVQQQLLGVNSDHAYLVALDVKEWRICTFYVEQDELVQTYLIDAANDVWNKVIN